MFIIDFDDTLFDTQSFKQARLEAVRACDVSDEVYWETYTEARNSPDGLFTYSNERHAEMIARRGYDKDVILAHLETTTGENLKDFLFPTTCEFLDKLKAFNKPLILLSLGDPSFQELKVKGSCIDSHFDRIFMVKQSKADIVKDLLDTHPDETPWFINDKVLETVELHKQFPNIKPVLRRSLKIAPSRYKQSNLPHYQTLDEIYDHITA